MDDAELGTLIREYRETCEVMDGIVERLHQMGRDFERLATALTRAFPNAAVDDGGLRLGDGAGTTLIPLSALDLACVKSQITALAAANERRDDYERQLRDAGYADQIRAYRVPNQRNRSA